MEAEAMPSLSSLLQGADQWGEILLLLPLLVALEAVLSADNAIALAAISRRLHDPDRQRQALNIGLATALVLRLLLILAAGWVLNFWPLQLLASAYLLWLSGRNLLSPGEGGDADLSVAQPSGSEPSGVTPSALPVAEAAEAASSPAAAVAAASQATGDLGHASSLAWQGPLLRVVLTLAFTDLAFSLDSVAAAVAVTDRLPLVMAGGLIGVIALRLTAELFIRWLEVYRHLEAAGYLAVALVGLRLLLRVAQPQLVIPEWALLLVVACLFLWGFSQRQPIAGDA
ncbi:MAG: hypothetical protein VKI83_00995 [Synechococcaceae cyanobacterium]|nr:hypothetical protein [Synechococcaceae cyanobacterium]